MSKRIYKYMQSFIHHLLVFWNSWILITSLQFNQKEQVTEAEIRGEIWSMAFHKIFGL